MRVAFRADASREIGTGHVMRCMTLATALRDRGADVSFVCREHPGHLCALLETRGFAVSRLPVAPSPSWNGAEPSHAGWLGASWPDDAAATHAALDEGKGAVDWLVVDHYALDHRWERELKARAAQIMVIDDLADRAHDCALILDQNLVPEMDGRYDGLVPESCGRLTGPQYALLQPEYAELHDRTPPRRGPVRRVLVYFGGADQANVTGRALSALGSLRVPHLAVDVVVRAGMTLADFPEARVVCDVVLHDSLPSLAPLMAQADLSIGAAGGTTWERLCLGLPALVVSLAENQRSVASALHDRGLVRWLGDETQVTSAVIADALRAAVDQGVDEQWSRRCRETVDGRGVSRVCAVLTASADMPLLLRSAGAADEALLLAWANDRVTRRNAFAPDQISPSVHHEWYQARLGDAAGCRIYVAETDGAVPVGQVRFDRVGKAWRISYLIASPFRGRRLGARVLDAAVERHRAIVGPAPLVAEVKPANTASRRVFHALGFSEIERRDVVEYHRDA